MSNDFPVSETAQTAIQVPIELSHVDWRFQTATRARWLALGELGGQSNERQMVALSCSGTNAQFAAHVIAPPR
jgi:hypothetical protein